jgi:hypothetical protein
VGDRPDEAIVAFGQAAVAWKQETGSWDTDTLDRIRVESNRLSAEAVEAAFRSAVPDDLLMEFTAQLDASGKGGASGASG